MQLGRSATVVNIVLILSFGLFTLGVFSPLMTVKKWFLFETTFSLLTGLGQLLQAGHYVLFAIVATFTLGVPLAKMILVAMVTHPAFRTHRGRARLLHGLSLCGKWSMIDVFIVAILVVVGKIRGLAEVELRYGLYMFATSVILIHMATCWLDTLVQRGAYQIDRIAGEH